MNRAVVVLLGLLASACATPRPAPAAEGRPSASCSLPGSAPEGALYLPPEQTAGSPWCFDPDSARLRAFLKRPAPKPTDTVDARALAEDVAALRELMRLQYSGFPELVQHRTFDVDAFFSGWLAQLEQAGECVSFEEGVLERLRELRWALVDMHHSVGGWGAKLRDEPHSRMRELQAVVDAPPDLASCTVEGEAVVVPGTLRTAPLLTTAGSKTLVTVSIRGDGAAGLRCGAALLPLSARAQTPARPRPGPDEQLYSHRMIGDTAVITIRQLGGTSAQTAQLEQLIADYPRHAAAKRIVFDFRQNGGGNDGYVYQWIDRAHRGLWDSGSASELVGALSPCFLWNVHTMMQVLDDTVDSPEAKERRRALRAAWPGQPSPVHWRYHPGLEESRAEAPFQGRVFALVDRRSVSSGESAAWALRQAMGAKLVGERTGGYLVYGNVVPYPLPRTGVIWQLATKKNHFEQEVEGVGLPVDAYLEDVTAPIEELLPLLDALEAK